MNRAPLALALESVAEQLTLVRPSLKKLPERRVQATETTPSATSAAVTTKRTRIRFAPFRARTVFETAPLSTGGVVSKSSPGTLIEPVHVSLAVPHVHPGVPVTELV